MKTQKHNYYVIRKFRNGRAINGYSVGKPNRFASLAAAEENAATFAAEVLLGNSYDYIMVGFGAVRAGMSVGSGYRIAEYSVTDRRTNGTIIRRDCQQ